MDLLNKSKLIDWVVKGDHVVIIQMTHCGDDQGDKIENSIIVQLREIREARPSRTGACLGK